MLRADIYRPDAPGKFPVLLERTPYNKDGGLEFGLKAAARGSQMAPATNTIYHDCAHPSALLLSVLPR